MGQRSSRQEKERETWASADSNLALEGKKIFSKFYEAQRQFDSGKGVKNAQDVTDISRVNTRLMSRFPSLAANLEIVAVIAAGSTGLVCKLRDRNSGKHFAGKFVRLPRRNSKEYAETLSHFQLEADIQKKCEHQYVVKLIQFTVANELAFFLMEYVPNTLLQNIVCSNQSGSYSEWHAAQYTMQVAKALSHCHSKGIVHLDIKLDNILCDGTRVKLCDFGLADYSPVDRSIGTALFVAPEILSQGRATSKADMWSFGVVIFILLCGYPPFQEGAHNRTLNENILGARYQFISPYWDNVSGLARDLVGKLLVRNQHARYSAEQVLSHPWIVSCCPEEYSPMAPTDQSTHHGTLPGQRSTIPQVDGTNDAHASKIPIGNLNRSATSQVCVPRNSDQLKLSHESSILSESAKSRTLGGTSASLANWNRHRERAKQDPSSVSSSLIEFIGVPSSSSRMSSQDLSVPEHYNGSTQPSRTLNSSHDSHMNSNVLSSAGTSQVPWLHASNSETDFQAAMGTCGPDLEDEEFIRPGGYRQPTPEYQDAETVPPVVMQSNVSSEENIARLVEKPARSDSDGAIKDEVVPPRRPFIRRSLSSVLRPPTWVPDNEAEACRICGRDFNFLVVRKHHCRACGQIICEHCSETRRIVASVDSQQPQRVCDRCKYTSFHPTNPPPHASRNGSGNQLVFGLRGI